MLQVAYTLMTEGGTPESIAEFDAELEVLTPEDEMEERIASIVALGGEVL